MKRKLFPFKNLDSINILLKGFAFQWHKFSKMPRSVPGSLYIRQLKPTVTDDHP
jgi:hypothetical protein